MDRDVAEKTKALEVCPLLSATTQQIRHSYVQSVRGGVETCPVSKGGGARRVDI